MTEDINLIELIESDILSFDSVSRFPEMGLTGNIQKAMLGKDRINHGIKVSGDEKGITINCDIIVYFGENIPQLCYEIQTKVKHDVEQVTDTVVEAVNISVEGIDRAPEADQEPEGDATGEEL